MDGLRDRKRGQYFWAIKFSVYHMKRILLAILAFVYLALSVRATVHLHDCIDIFASPSTDLHSAEKEKTPCKNDPIQCKLETQRRIIEAPSKWLRVIDPVLIPLSAFQFRQHYFDLQQYFPTSVFSNATGKTSLLALHCIWRIWLYSSITWRVKHVRVILLNAEY